MMNALGNVLYRRMIVTARLNTVITCQASDQTSSSKSLRHVSTGLPLTWSWGLKQSTVMGIASAVLGPLCDGQHSHHDVLQYAHPIHISVPGLELETTWWTPLLFGVAGIIIGSSHPLLDSIYSKVSQPPKGGYDPSWSFVLAGITAFVLQYALSAYLADPSVAAPQPIIHAVLATTALGQWYLFEGTRQGLFMACLTAVGGPAVEIALIAFGNYQYSDPQVLGIPFWIPWVYFCGAPAVGNLGRIVVKSTLQQTSKK